MIRIVLIVIVRLSHPLTYAWWVVLEKPHQFPATQTVYFDPDTNRWEEMCVTL